MNCRTFYSCCLFVICAALPARAEFLVVVGLATDDVDRARLSSTVDAWQAVARAAGEPIVVLGLDDPQDQDTIKTRLRAAIDSASPRCLVLLGHCSFDGQHAKLMLRGPDVSATELSAWLDASTHEPIVINAASASGAFLKPLSRPGRVVVTATASGAEWQPSRFGKLLPKSLLDPSADRDRDGQVSLLEAAISASIATAESYQSEGRLVPEHPRLAEGRNGGGVDLASLADTSRHTDVNSVALAAAYVPVPSQAERALSQTQRAERDRLEHSIRKLRGQRESLGEDAYFDALERLCLELADVLEPVRRN